MSIRITGSASGLDTDAMVKELVHAYDEQGQKYTKAKTKTEWKQEAWKTLNGKIKNFYSKYASSMRFSNNYNKKSTTVSDPNKASVVANGDAVSGIQKLKITSLAAAGYLTGADLRSKYKDSDIEISGSTKLSDLGYGGTGTTIIIGKGKKGEDGTYESTQKFEVDGDTTLNQFANFVKTAGYNANFDAGTGRMFISSKETGLDNDFTFIAGSEVTDLLGITGSGFNKQDAADASINLNGVDFTSSSNSFSINGLTITAKSETGDEFITLNTDTDIDGIYNGIKDFIKEYNSLINEMDKLFNAPSAKKYEPLTSEEKDAMTDEEIEKWETKIKDSLLRRDGDLDTISSALKNSMLKAFEIDGKTYSLSSFGINTLGYFDSADNEKNAFHIDGDKDDANTSANSDKLRAMIASDPNAVSSFFSQLASGMYDAMYKIEKESNNYTTFGSFYSDKKLQSEYDDQTKQITKWEKYVADIEDKYYKQFAAMESSLSSMQSQQNYLSQLFS